MHEQRSVESISLVKTIIDNDGLQSGATHTHSGSAFAGKNPKPISCLHTLGKTLFKLTYSKVLITVIFIK